MWMKSKGGYMIYYIIIIGLFVIFYSIFIYSLCKISKEADIRADKIFKEMRRNENKSDL